MAVPSCAGKRVGVRLSDIPIMASFASRCPTVTDKYDSNPVLPAEGVARNVMLRAGKEKGRLLGRVALFWQANAVKPGFVFVHSQTAIDEPAHDQRVNRMFLSLDAGGHVFFGIALKHWHLCL